MQKHKNTILSLKCCTLELPVFNHAVGSCWLRLVLVLATHAYADVCACMLTKLLYFLFYWNLTIVQTGSISYAEIPVYRSRRKRNLGCWHPPCSATLRYKADLFELTGVFQTKRRWGPCATAKTMHANWFRPSQSLLLQTCLKAFNWQSYCN